MKACLGIDVGGTKTAAGIVDGAGRILERRAVPTLPGRGGAAVLADVRALASGLLARAGELGIGVTAIGVGVAELVDGDGNVQSENLIRWRGVPVRRQLEDLAPCVVEADSRAAALGEARFGAGRPFAAFFYVTIGTGIGSAFHVGGKVHAGARGCAGTIASAPATTYCAACGAESRAILEEHASGPALVARYNRLKPGAAKSAEEVAAAAHAGDPAAVEVVRTGATLAGSTLGLIVNVLDPEAVIVGGGLGAAGGLYWQTLVEATRRHVWSEVHRHLPILPAANGADAGVVGAAAAAMGIEGESSPPFCNRSTSGR